MIILTDEKELLDHKFVVAGAHPLPHFYAFYNNLLFEKLEGLDIVAYMESFSESFLSNYSGNIICLAQHYATELMDRHDRKYSVILLDHGPFPRSSRVSLPLRADLVIGNGSLDLIGQLDSSEVGAFAGVGWFVTDYFLPYRERKKALIQMVPGYESRVNLVELCHLLHDKGYTVNFYDHLLYHVDLSLLPAWVRVVSPGLDYLKTLSTCSHFLHSGTSGFITAMATPGCRMYCLSQDWYTQQSPLFRKMIKQSSHLSAEINQIAENLEVPAKYDRRLMRLLYGHRDTAVIPKINYVLDKWGTQGPRCFRSVYWD